MGTDPISRKAGFVNIDKDDGTVFLTAGVPAIILVKHQIAGEFDRIGLP